MGRTVSTRLDGGLDIPNALDRDPVLVVPVDVLVLQLADLVEQNTQLIRHVGDILVAGFTPKRKLLLFKG